jgi:hypothetical protein
MMTTAAILIARIRGRERVMQNIILRNPESYSTNPYYIALHTAVCSYRDALAQIERAGIAGHELTLSR